MSIWSAMLPGNCGCQRNTALRPPPQSAHNLLAPGPGKIRRIHSPLLRQQLRRQPESSEIQLLEFPFVGLSGLPRAPATKRLESNAQIQNRKNARSNQIGRPRTSLHRNDDWPRLSQISRICFLRGRPCNQWPKLFRCLRRTLAVADKQTAALPYFLCLKGKKDYANF